MQLLVATFHILLVCGAVRAIPVEEGSSSLENVHLCDDLISHSQFEWNDEVEVPLTEWSSPFASVSATIEETRHFDILNTSEDSNWSLQNNIVEDEGGWNTSLDQFVINDVLLAQYVQLEEFGTETSIQMQMQSVPSSGFKSVPEASRKRTFSVHDPDEEESSFSNKKQYLSNSWLDLYDNIEETTSNKHSEPYSEELMSIDPQLPFSNSFSNPLDSLEGFSSAETTKLAESVSSFSENLSRNYINTATSTEDNDETIHSNKKHYSSSNKNVANIDTRNSNKQELPSHSQVALTEAAVIEKEMKTRAENNCAESQFELGWLIFHNISSSPGKALHWFEKAANQGHAFAQWQTGYIYEHGNEQLKDMKKAIFWYEKAACQGNVFGQFYLAECYENGKGVEKDWNIASYWYTKIINQEVQLGKYASLMSHELKSIMEKVLKKNVTIKKLEKSNPLQEQEIPSENAGNLSQSEYLIGLDHFKRAKKKKSRNPRKYTEALKWFQRAAENNNSLAQTYTGICYEQGLGASKDFGKAVFWYEKAAKQDYAEAQYRAGSCYEKGGVGLTQDWSRAMYWFSKATEQGLLKAQKKLESCKRQIAIRQQHYTASSNPVVQKKLELRSQQQNALQQQNYTASSNPVVQKKLESRSQQQNALQQQHYTASSNSVVQKKLESRSQQQNALQQQHYTASSNPVVQKKLELRGQQQNAIRQQHYTASSFGTAPLPNYVVQADITPPAIIPHNNVQSQDPKATLLRNFRNEIVSLQNPIQSTPLQGASQSTIQQTSPFTIHHIHQKLIFQTGESLDYYSPNLIHLSMSVRDDVYFFTLPCSIENVIIQTSDANELPNGNGVLTMRWSANRNNYGGLWKDMMLSMTYSGFLGKNSITHYNDFELFHLIVRR